MKFSENQLKWIEENSELIENRDLDKLRQRLWSGKIMTASEKTQLLAGLIIVLDIPIEIRMTDYTHYYGQGFKYLLYIKGTDNGMISWYYEGVNKKGIIRGLREKLLSNGVDGKVLKEVMNRAEYNVN